MPVISMWNELNGYLDDDERLVFPDMYIKNRHLYDKIQNVVYLIKQREHPEARLQWVSELALPRALRNGDFDMLAQQLIVRLRYPWNEIRSEWLCSQKELDANREYYEVLDIFLRVQRKDNPEEVPLFNVLEFETNRDDYEVVEARYLVTLKLAAETQARLLGIDPDGISTYMQQ